MFSPFDKYLVTIIKHPINNFLHKRWMLSPVYLVFRLYMTQEDLCGLGQQLSLQCALDLEVSRVCKESC